VRSYRASFRVGTGRTFVRSLDPKSRISGPVNDAARLLLFLLAAGVTLGLLSPLIAERLLFLPSREDPGPPPSLAGIAGEDITLAAEDGTQLHGWWYGAGANAPAVLLLHGNAGNIQDRIPLALGYLQRGISILLLDYRGYGRSDGRPTERGLTADAFAGIGWLANQAGDPGHIVVHGRSLGGAVGARALVEWQERADGSVAGLVLDSSFTSLEEIGRTTYPFLPGLLLRRIRGRFDTPAALARLALPVLVVHGSEDRLVPVAMGRELHARAPAGAEWFEVRGADHNDLHLVGGSAYFDRIARFVREVTDSRSDTDG
jgi:uncharacterized protein